MAESDVAESAPVSEIGYAAPDPGTWWGGLAEPTPELRWPLNLGVYDRMRTDSQITSVLRAVTMPVRRTAWRIQPNGARDEVVAQVAEDLGLPIDGADPEPPGRTRDRFSWDEHLRHALLCLPFGHMAFEQVARIDERGRARLRKLAPRMPATISDWEIDPDGGLRAIVQEPPSWSSPTDLLRQPPTRAVRIPVERLVVYSNEREAGDWRGRSMLRPAYKFWLLKDRMLRTGAQTVERNGMGVPVYEGAPRETNLDAGLKIARSLRSGDTSGAAIRNGAKLTLKGVEGDLPDAERWVRYYDEQMARAALLHFLNLGQQTGSWALGSTFAEFFQMSLQTVADDVKTVIDQHVIEDIVDWNWGVDERAPRLVCDEIGSRHPATAEALRALADSGLVLPDRELEEAIRQMHGLPPKGAYSRPAGPAPDPQNAPPTPPKPAEGNP